MRFFAKTIVVALGLMVTSPVLADQNDPRLDNLFNILQSSDQQMEIRAAENLIWATWLHHDNAEYGQLMRMGSRALGEQRFDQAIGIFSSLIEKAPRLRGSPEQARHGLFHVG